MNISSHISSIHLQRFAVLQSKKRKYNCVYYVSRAFIICILMLFIGLDIPLAPRNQVYEGLIIKLDQ